MNLLQRMGGRKFAGLVLCVGAVVYLVRSGGDTGNIAVAIGAIGGMYLTFCGGNAMIEKFHAGRAE